MKRFFTWLWANKQMVTSAITTSVATLGSANVISPALALKVTAVTAALMTLFALAYTYFKSEPLPANVDPQAKNPPIAPTLIGLGLLIGLLASGQVRAAAPSPSLDFTVAVGNTPTLTWSCPAGTTSAAASGAWSGSKSVSGTQTAPAITDTASYTITCITAPATTADLSWTAPTQNTDGSPLTDLAGYGIYSGPSASALTLRQSVAVPALNFQVTGLPAGTTFFAVDAVNASGVRSALSTVGSKTIVAASSVSATVTIKVPRTVTGLTVQ